MIKKLENCTPFLKKRIFLFFHDHYIVYKEDCGEDIKFYLFFYWRTKNSLLKATFKRRRNAIYFIFFYFRPYGKVILNPAT